jgi:hypothetical protein
MLKCLYGDDVSGKMGGNITFSLYFNYKDYYYFLSYEKE